MINQCWPYQVFWGLCPSLANDAAVTFFYLLWACAQSLHLSLHHCIFPSLLFTTVRSPTDKNSKWWNSTICIATCPHLTPMTKHNMGTQEGDELWSIKEKNWRTMQLMTEWKPSMHSCYSLAFDHLSKRGPRLQCAKRKPLWRAMRHYTPRTFSVTSSSLCWFFLFLPLRLINNIPPSTSVRISCPFSIPSFLSKGENLPSVLFCHAFASAVPPPTPLPISACLITWSAKPI